MTAVAAGRGFFLPSLPMNNLLIQFNTGKHDAFNTGIWLHSGTLISVKKQVIVKSTSHKHPKDVII